MTKEDLINKIHSFLEGAVTKATIKQVMEAIPAVITGRGEGAKIPGVVTLKPIKKKG